MRTLKNMKLVGEIAMIDFTKKTVLLVLVVSIGSAKFVHLQLLMKTIDFALHVFKKVIDRILH